MRKLLGVLALSLVAAASAAQAAPITYTFSGQVSGSLAGQAFALSGFTLSLASDTDTVFQPRPDFRPTLYNSGATTLQFTINGVSGTFDTQFNAFSFTDPNLPGQALVGFTEVGGDDLIDVSDGALAGYDLQSTIASPLRSPIDFLNFGTTFQTSAGELVFANDGDASASFQSALTAVPEPATWAMMIAGVGAVGGRLRRRRAQTASIAYR